MYRRWPHLVDMFIGDIGMIPPQATCSPEEYGTAAENLCRMVCDAAEIRDGMRIIDVGCGFGGTLASLNERFSDLQLVGVNIDARQLERAAELVTPQNGNSIEFVEADAARIPLPDNSFDVVLAVECVFHFNRPGFFAETERLLDHGGTLTLSDFVPSERSLEYLDTDRPFGRRGESCGAMVRSTCLIRSVVIRNLPKHIDLCSVRQLTSRKTLCQLMISFIPVRPIGPMRGRLSCSSEQPVVGKRITQQDDWLPDSAICTRLIKYGGG